MGSKAVVLLALLLATVLFITSEVTAARDLVETSTNFKETAEQTNNGIEDAKYGGYNGGGGGYNGGGGGYNGGGGGYHGGGGYGGGGGCRRRCCRYGRCGCCSEEAVEKGN